MSIHQNHWDGFKIALYQFMMPVVSLDADGQQIRMENFLSLLHQIDHDILKKLDNVESDSTSLLPCPRQPGLPGRRCKDIGVVLRPPFPGVCQPLKNLPDPTQPLAEEPLAKEQKSKKQKPQKASSKIKKRTLAGSDEMGDQPSQKKRKYNPEGKSNYFKSLKRKCKFKFLFYSSILKLTLHN
jgi:hypothetical protein